MSHTPKNATSSRRQFLKTSGQIAAASALVGMATPAVHAAGSDEIRVALIGCGGRGTGAAKDALATKSGPIKLVAMADVSKERLESSWGDVNGGRPGQVDVPPDRRFLGLDAYKKAMDVDVLKPGDIAIFATPLAFRWVHFKYAIEKGLNVFMEKPLTADGPTSKRMLALGEAADKKNLKVGVGLMSRHSRHLEELAKRVHGGEIGEIILMRGYRMHGPIGTFASEPKPAGISDLMYQIQRFHSFLWSGGGCFSDFNIHIIDHLCWMKNAWPVKAQGTGGRHYKMSPKGVAYVDQNFDSYAVEYTFADGTKFNFEGRCMEGCDAPYQSFLHGTKGSAIASKGGDCGGPSSLYKTQSLEVADLISETKGEGNPYQNEWDDLVDAIRNNKPYSELKRGVEASLVTSMGRAAAHTGQVITFDGFLNSDHEYAPDLDKLDENSPAPLQPDADGKYPVPMPGKKKDREF